MEIILALLFAAFVFWLAYRILNKAGVEPLWMFALMIPLLNVIMVWVFAFAEWPNLKKTKTETSSSND